MDDHSTPPSRPDIVITREDALSEHATELVERRSRLAEGAPADQVATPWYFRSWLILMLAGALAATGAWAIIEPVFDDMHYVRAIPEDVELLAFPGGALGTMTLAGEKMQVTPATTMTAPDGRRVPLDPAVLEEGLEIGAWVEAEGADAPLGAAVIEPHPSEPATAKSQRSVRERERRSNAIGIFLFAIVAGMVGLFIGAADGIACRAWRRALACGAVGIGVGALGGLLSGLVGGLVYAPLSALADGWMQQEGSFTPALGLIVQVMGRTVAWGLAGCAMGLGQGIALRSTRLLAYGLIGGIVGGLVGGMLFDPIDLMLLGGRAMSAHWSRLVAIGFIGAAVGAAIGVVELLARDAWLKMLRGPLAGKEFLLHRDAMTLGSSPRCNVFLFSDDQIAPEHAVIRSVAEASEIERRSEKHPVFVNNRPVARARLRHGDEVRIGSTVLLFQARRR